MSQSLSTIKAIILDMDGTLIDTESLYKMSWQAAAQELGFVIDDESYQQFLGIPFAVCLEQVKTILPSQITIKIFLQRLLLIQNRLKKELGFPMKPGACELLTLLKNHPIPTALVTSSDRDNITENFAHTPFAGMFDIIVAFEDVAQHKPHPAPYIFACQQLNLLPAYALVIEDSNNGAISAIDAGCQTIMVPDTFPPDTQVKKNALAIQQDLHQTIANVIQPILINYQSAPVMDNPVR